MSYVYEGGFYDYIDAGSSRSAQLVIAQLVPWLSPESVLDLGCGRGAWLAQWKAAGVPEVLGIDGDYVERDSLHIDPAEFVGADLSSPIALDRTFDLVQSLEVAEHLPEGSAADFVGTLCRHGDVVLFSAAVKGQGGENHINEQPLEYWRRHFAEAGYHPYDCVRPAVRQHAEIEPWYRYNTLLYANERGAERLPEAVRGTRVAEGAPIPEVGSLGWRVRTTLVAQLPRPAVDGIARLRARVLVMLRGRPSA